MILVDPDGRQSARYEPVKQRPPDILLPGRNYITTRELSQAVYSWWSSVVTGVGAALGTINWSNIWTEEHPYNLSQEVEITSNSEEESQPKGKI